jgi:PDZ domain/Aspartyl protease
MCVQNSPGIQQSSAIFELEDSKGVQVPFEFRAPEKPLIVVRASINGSKPYPFVIDTGSPDALFITEWAQREIKAPLTGKTIPLIPGNSVAKITKACDVTLIGKTEGHNIEFSVENAEVADIPLLDGYFNPKVAGLIGARVFFAITTRFDFDKQTITFFPFKHPRLKLSTPYFNAPMLPTEGGQLLNIGLNLPGHQAASFYIDTGDAESYVVPTESRMINRLAEKTGGSHSDISGTSPALTLLLPQIDLGAWSISAPTLMVVGNAKVSSIGTDLFACFRVTIDPGNRFVTLEPRKGYRYRRVGDPGVNLISRGGKLVIGELRSLAAAQTPLATDDEVISIDGRNTAEMTLTQASAALNGYEGEPLTLSVNKPSGKPVTVSLLRRSVFPEVVCTDIGVTLIISKGTAPRIFEVVPGSQADTRGIHVGDQILAINGKSIADASADDLWVRMHGDLAKNISGIEIKQKSDGANRKVTITH